MVDATNLTAPARAAILRRASIAGAPAVALVLLPPAATVHARNARRPGRTVPADVVDRQLAAAAALGGDAAAIRTRLRAEGFAAVHVWLGPEAEDAARRGRRAAPARQPRPPRPPPSQRQAAGLTDPPAIRTIATAAMTIPTRWLRVTRSWRIATARITVVTG